MKKRLVACWGWQWRSKQSPFPSLPLEEEDDTEKKERAQYKRKGILVGWAALLCFSDILLLATPLPVPSLVSASPPTFPLLFFFSAAAVGILRMADSLDMPLDDLITKNKPLHRRTRRNPGSGSGGPTATGRRFHNRAATRAAAAPYHHLNFQLQAPPAYGQLTAMAGAGGGATETDIKLYISNLDFAVSNEDIKELFSEVGHLKRYSINYDRSGRSKGTAEVVFSRRSDALAAVKKYTNVQLDGKPMKIEVIGTNIEAPAPATFAFNIPAGNFNFPSRSGSVRGGGGGWPRGGGAFVGRGRGRGGHGRGRGGRGNRQVSAEDLDADLDKYHAEAMQIS